MLCYTLPRKNYTKDKQGKVTRQYQKIWKKENFGYLLSQKITCQVVKILWFVKSTGQQIIQKLFIMGRKDHEILLFRFSFV